jgi:hypothetical protein
VKRARLRDVDYLDSSVAPSSEPREPIPGTVYLMALFPLLAIVLATAR